MSSETLNSRPNWTRIAALVALALLVISGGWLGWRVYRIWKAATALRADLGAARVLVEDGIRDIDPRDAASLLRASRADLERLQASAGPFLWVAPNLGWVPRYGPTIEAAPVLLDVAVDLTTAGETLVDDFAPLLEKVEGEAGAADESLLSEGAVTLARAGPELRATLMAVQEAQSALNEVEIDGLDPRLRDRVRQLDGYLPLLEQGVRAGLMMPELLGVEGSRTYLLLVQNEDELRASGGFISGVAQVTVEGGDIGEMTFEDSYAVDDFSEPYPEPPAALQDLMLADLWLFRDSNWSPDFPTSARKAIELYRVSRDVEIDGVIALDQRAISLLLGPLGPLEVEGADAPVTGENVLQVARRAWAPGEEIASDWWGQRKDIMGSVLDAAVAELQAGFDRAQLIDLGQAGLTALREKHLLLYLPDPAAAAALAELGWDGAVAYPAGDYLMVVDTNVGFNKVNAVVEESLDYAVDLTDPTQPRARLSVQHRHPVAGWSGPCSQTPRYDATYEGMTERCYYDYVRIYAPSGAELQQATAHPVPGSILLSGERQPGGVEVAHGEAGKTVFATLLVVRPGEDVETTFVYDLPTATVEKRGDQWRYRLTIQKQPGTDVGQVDVMVQLGSGARVAHTDPAPAERQGGSLQYQMDLRRDVTIDVIWTP